MASDKHDLLRFITAGSVDDGKSTLIGRLLYDSRAIAVDQALALASAKNRRVASGEEIDFSLLTDGLEAEREQGITIDVAYRYFRSGKRRFIIADTPGHEQYTRNMATGASTADAAIILIDATKPFDKEGRVRLLNQTRRHSAIVRLLGVPHVVVTVNKMDLLDHDQSKFDAIREAYGELAERIGIANAHYIPISALKGDNVAQRSEKMGWYDGPTLLELLESLPSIRESKSGDSRALRFPVQLTIRQDGSSRDDFRGFMGRVESGSLKKGDEIRVMPSGLSSAISEIYSPNGGCDGLEAGAVGAIRLADEIDVSRGDVIVARQDGQKPVQAFSANLCWFDEDPLNLRRKYVLKLAASSVTARVNNVENVFDIETLSSGQKKKFMEKNDIGVVEIKLQKPIFCDPYDENPAMGSFILIDDATNHTLAAGMINRFD